MKPILLSILAATSLSVAAWGQGTLTFANFGGGVNAPVFQVDGTTRLIGPSFQAILLAGPTQTSLVPVTSQTPFLTGTQAGYFDGGTVTIPTVAPGGTAFVEIIAWDSTLGGTTTGATYGQAYSAFHQVGGMGNVWGASFYNYPSGVETPLGVVTGGGGNPPASLTGLTAFTLAAVVPEPSSLSVAALATAALMTFRRRK